MTIQTIQYCLVLLAFVVAWCEYTKFFANSPYSIIIRFATATSLLGLCYKAPMIQTLPPDAQFLIMILVAAITFLTAHFIFKRYEYNKFRKMRVLHKRCQELRSVDKHQTTSTVGVKNVNTTN